MKKSLVLLSGGIDSYVALALEKGAGFECSTLSFAYEGQPIPELRAIREISNRENVINYSIFHPSISFLGQSLPIRSFVPNNLLYYSMAVVFAGNNGFQRVVGGQNRDDFTYCSDAGNSFYESFNNLVKSYSFKDVQIFQPLLDKTKREVVELGLSLNLPLKITWSCEGRGPGTCGVCPNCTSRHKIFNDLGISLK